MNHEELKRWVTTRTDNCLSQAGLQVSTSLKRKHHTVKFKLFNRDHYEGSKGLGQITKTVVVLGEERWMRTFTSLIVCAKSKGYTERTVKTGR